MHSVLLQIPLTLVHDSTVQRTGANPVLLVVYGAYGHALSLDYHTHRLPLLKQGWVVSCVSHNLVLYVLYLNGFQLDKPFQLRERYLHYMKFT